MEILDVTIITNRNKFTLFGTVFIIGGTALTGYLFYLTKSIFILCGGMFVSYLFPFIFQKAFRKRFSQDVSVSFSDNLFSVEFKDLFTDNNLRKDINRFSEIKYFKTWDSSRNDFSTLKLIFKDGRNANYLFTGQKNDDRSETDINWLFRNAVETYNAARETEEKIKIIPSFFSTNAALYLGWVLILTMASVTIYFGIKKPKTLIASIGFIGIYFQMVAMRKKAIKEKSKFS